jgi:hypothetical protein
MYDLWYDAPLARLLATAYAVELGTQMRKISWFAVAAAGSRRSNITDWYNPQFSNTTRWYRMAPCLRRRGNRHHGAHSCAVCRFVWKRSRRHLQRDPLYAPLLTEVIGHRTAAERRPSTVGIVAKCEWR